jgi:hypothetical protein
MATASVETASPMEAATAVEATAAYAAAETTACVTMRAATYEAMPNRPAVIGEPAATSVETTSAKARSTIEPAATIEAAAVKSTAIETATVEAAMEPGTGADEHASYKPIRAVVAVRRTIIRVIAVVAVGTNRSRASVTVVARISHTDNDPLSIRKARAK